MQLEMHELRELGGAEPAGEGLLAAVEPHVGLQVGRRGEALAAHLALVRLLARVDQVVLLQVRQLREALFARLADEGPLPGVGPQVHLQVGQLAEGLVAHVALVVHLPVLLPQREGQRAVTSPQVGAAAAADADATATAAAAAAVLVVMVVVVVVVLALAEVQHLVHGSVGDWGGGRGRAVGPAGRGPVDQPHAAGPRELRQERPGREGVVLGSGGQLEHGGKGVERVERVAGHQHGRQGAQLAVAGQELGHERLVLERVEQRVHPALHEVAAGEVRELEGQVRQREVHGRLPVHSFHLAVGVGREAGRVQQRAGHHQIPRVDVLPALVHFLQQQAVHEAVAVAVVSGQRQGRAGERQGREFGEGRGVVVGRRAAPIFLGGGRGLTGRRGRASLQRHG